jgi:hypothetical protein
MARPSCAFLLFTLDAAYDQETHVPAHGRRSPFALRHQSCLLPTAHTIEVSEYLGHVPFLAEQSFHSWWLCSVGNPASAPLHPAVDLNGARVSYLRGSLTGHYYHASDHAENLPNYSRGKGNGQFRQLQHGPKCHGQLMYQHVILLISQRCSYYWAMRCAPVHTD